MVNATYYATLTGDADQLTGLMGGVVDRYHLDLIKGATRALRYNPNPGKYIGCYPYKNGDKAWAQ
jgi:hypothetical protein